VTVRLTCAHLTIFRHQLWRKLSNHRIPYPLCDSSGLPRFIRLPVST
jgi:hypothetical protein